MAPCRNRSWHHLTNCQLLLLSCFDRTLLSCFEILTTSVQTGGDFGRKSKLPSPPLRNPDHVEQLLAFLRFPSISTDPAHAGDVAACAGWLAGRLEAIGLNAVVHPTAGHPIVVARNAHVPGRRTVMIYGHYDVQPVDQLELWQTPPFEPRIENGVIFARGAADNKGQIFAHG